jgi:hypothetical protein
MCLSLTHYNITITTVLVMLQNVCSFSFLEYIVPFNLFLALIWANKLLRLSLHNPAPPLNPFLALIWTRVLAAAAATAAAVATHQCKSARRGELQREREHACSVSPGPACLQSFDRVLSSISIFKSFAPQRNVGDALVETYIKPMAL